MPLVRNVVRTNLYRDSMRLMQVTEEAKKLHGVLDASVVMGTSTNKELLLAVGLMTDEGMAASASDMVIAVSLEGEGRLEEVLRAVDGLLAGGREGGSSRYSDLGAALAATPDAGLALVSIPGEHVRPVVTQLLDRGIHVHLFSDHVSVEDEVFLKKRALEKGLLLLGPGAGTSIIGGKAIAFANAVGRGRIGLVAAAGTGLQEVSVLLDRVGVGVSQGLGVGGGDVKDSVGGMMSLASIDALEEDPGTDIICLVGKPPGKETARKITERMASGKKKYVLCLLGSESAAPPGVHVAASLHSAAALCARLSGGRADTRFREELMPTVDGLLSAAADIHRLLEPGQKYVRGLYTGGTLTFESLLILRELVGDVMSNAPLEGRLKLRDPHRSTGHTLVDMGEEEFTAGRAHPMIDPTVRKLRLVEEAADPEVCCVAMDFVLGYGSNPDPAGAMLDSIRKARGAAGGRRLPILAYVCGTERDPQVLSDQVRKLEDEGVAVARSNAEMAVLAALVASRGAVDRTTLERVVGRMLHGEGD